MKQCECLDDSGIPTPVSGHFYGCPLHPTPPGRAVDQPGVEVARDIVILDGEGVVLCWLGDRDEALRIISQMVSPATRDCRVLEIATWDITNVGRDGETS